jgi:hypothetical protein
LGIVWDPTASQSWIVTASYAQYVDAIANSIADAGSAAGNPQTYQFIYRGADINGSANAATLTETAQAVRQVFDWYDTNKGSLPLNGNPTIPGVATKVGGDLKSPSVTEYAGGVARQLARAAVRVDYVYRDWKDFYVQRTDTTTGHVQNSFGQTFDLTLIENTNDLGRRYSGGTFQATYRFGSASDIGTTYTLSRTWGNVDGESVNGGPSASTILQYPEYKRPSWNYPDGDLSTDQRHRARVWINYGVPRFTGLTVSLLQILESGVPFNASSGSGVDPRPFVSVPSYVTPPAGNATTYYFPVDCATAPAAATDACVGSGARDSFRTEGQKRTDFAATYNFRVSGAKGLDLFVQAHIINLFNQEQLCGCGGTVFQNGGGVTQTSIDQTVRTAATNPANYQTFNPFSTTPVQETNWAYGPLFGQALTRLAWTSPRQFRIGFGVRF